MGVRCVSAPPGSVEGAASSPASRTPPPRRGPGWTARVREFGSVAGRWVRARWQFFLAAALYLVVVLVVFRLQVVAAPGQFPQGVNALNEFLLFNFWKRYPLNAWHYPFYDWGIAYPGYTGPNVLDAGVFTMSPATLVRVVELGSLWASGLTAYVLCRNLGAHPLGAGVAGFYYLLQGETPQFFEGHVAFVISVALAPIFLLAVYRFGATLSLRWGLVLVVALYLLASIGDLGALFFLLFFSTPLLAYSVVQHRTYRGIGRSQAFAITCSVALFLALMAPWWLPYLLGARPQYTTSITVTVVPFAHLRGEPIGYSFAGISWENSFTHYALGQVTFALDYQLLAPLYFVTPVLIAVYAFVKRTVGRLLLYGSAVLSILITTGPLYWGVSSLNGFFWAYVPFFDYIPAPASWLLIAVVAYTIFLGWLISDVLAIATHRPRVGPSGSPAPAESAPTAGESATTGSGRSEPVARRYRWHAASRRRAAMIVVVLLAGFVLVSVALEDEETFTTPPHLFEFPAAYVEGYEYVGAQPSTGGLMTVPFGAVYERTPWGGVSGSTQIISGSYTNSNTVVFEAGSPYSLAMDEFINHALQDGTTTNLTKFLQGTNVEFVAATDYPNWAQSSSAFGSPEQQYGHLTQQDGLGTPVFSAGYQTVYRLPDPVGNLSFHPTYYVYFGNDSLVNEVTDQPFYDGTQPLVNASEIDSASLPEVVEHASAIIVNPTTLASLPSSEHAVVSEFHVPVISLAGALDVVGNQTPPVAAPWNASNALAIQPPSNETPVVYALNQSLLFSEGAANASGSVRASCPSGALLTLIDGPHEYPLTYVNPSTTFAPVNLTNRSVVVAGIDNQGRYPYNGSVNVAYANGQPYLLWNVTPNNTTAQFLQFAIHDLTGVSGLTLTFSNQPSLPTDPLMRVYFAGTFVNISGYRSAGTPGSNGTSYSFQFSYATGPGVPQLATSLGNITEFWVEFGQTGSASHLNVTDLAYLRSVSGSPYENLRTPTLLPSQSNSLEIVTTPECSLDTVQVTAGELPAFPPGFVSYRSSQANPLAWEATSNVSGWGLLLEAQTFFPLWQLLVSGTPTGVHVAADMGLNAWIVNLTAGASLLVRYLGQEYEMVGIVIEGVGVPLVAAAILISRSRGARTRLGSWATRIRRLSRPAR